MVLNMFCFKHLKKSCFNNSLKMTIQKVPSFWDWREVRIRKEAGEGTEAGVGAEKEVGVGKQVSIQCSGANAAFLLQRPPEEMTKKGIIDTKREDAWETRVEVAAIKIVESWAEGETAAILLG